MGMKLRERIRLIGRAIFNAWPNISLGEFDAAMDAAFGGTATRSGVTINERTAISLSAVFNAVTLISGALASCALVLYRRTGERSRERFKEHSLYRVLHNQANDNLTSFDWVQTSMGHLLLWGNAYSLVRRDLFGAVMEIERILAPSQVKVFRKKGSMIPSYDITLEAGEQPVTLTRDRIFHIPGLGFDGLTGFSVLTLARESFGLSVAAEKYGQEFFGKGIHADGFLQRPKDAPRLSTDAEKRLIGSIQQENQGSEGRGKYIVLEEGTTFKENVMPLEDAQFLSSRTFQIQEVARWFNLSTSRLKEYSRANFSNIEALQIMDVQDCFLPWARRFETQINAQLIEPGLRETLFAEFKLDTLLRADSVARNNALAIQRQWGVRNANEWREIENENPQPGDQGDKYLVPSNYTIADKLGEEPEQPVFQPTAPQPDEKPPGDGS